MTNKYDINAQMEQAEQEYGLNQKNDSEWYNLEDGANRLRILTQFTVIPYHYVNGKYHICVGKEKCPFCKDEVGITTKWMCYVWDKRDEEDNVVKLAMLPYTVAKQVQELQNNPEWTFEATPMPYDLTINRTQKKGKDGKDRPQYSTVGSPTRSDVPEEILETLKEQNAPETIKQNMKNKRLKELGLEEVAEQTEEPQ